MRAATHPRQSRPSLGDVAALQARAARAEVEAALDAAGWPWSRRLSAWIDALVAIEEAT